MTASTKATWRAVDIQAFIFRGMGKNVMDVEFSTSLIGMLKDFWPLLLYFCKPEGIYLALYVHKVEASMLITPLITHSISSDRNVTVHVHYLKSAITLFIGNISLDMGQLSPSCTLNFCQKFPLAMYNLMCHSKSYIA